MKRVTRTVSFNYTTPDEYCVEVIAIPDHQGYEMGVWDCDFKTIQVPKCNGHLWFRVISCSDSELVAWATFSAGPVDVQCDIIEVCEGARRKGTADALYTFAACFFNAYAVPSSNLSDFTIKFWYNRNAITC